MPSPTYGHNGIHALCVAMVKRSAERAFSFLVTASTGRAGVAARPAIDTAACGALRVANGALRPGGRQAVTRPHLARVVGLAVPVGSASQSAGATEQPDAARGKAPSQA
ncbi:hypothetical protein Atai01_42450 [Amycolatopsis taiwanensis]|uniref:Uncharacterized protein n=1 Tax=Amycolatopsis taiwanensis TaxID=342230 RepID=A0A9W6VIM4_9PSEU|nr:hypothetical protein Atai01_42450 [Amycolatopsis taiwanensis]